jgi:hypothetical protein
MSLGVKHDRRLAQEKCGSQDHEDHRDCDNAADEAEPRAPEPAFIVWETVTRIAASATTNFWRMHAAATVAGFRRMNVGGWRKQ